MELHDVEGFVVGAAVTVMARATVAMVEVENCMLIVWVWWLGKLGVKTGGDGALEFALIDCC